MASFVERISVIIDTKIDGFQSGLKKMRADIAAAEGVTGKFKAGFAGMTDSLKANAGTLATAGGAALVAFGAKSIAAFQGTAKAAIDLSKATGLSVEQASRWIAVGDDFGVSAEQIATSVGRIGKELDAEKWAKYGISTRDAAGQARDANEIFLDVLEVLNNTKPAERAKVGAELIGKGWQGLAPILGKTRDEYEDMLGSVEDGQVITKKEADRAEKSRLAYDKLTDAVGDLALNFGGLLAEAAPALDLLADGVTKVQGLADALGALERKSVDSRGPLEGLGDVFTRTINPVENVKRTWADAMDVFGSDEPTKAAEKISIVGDEMYEVGDEARKGRGSQFNYNLELERSGEAARKAAEELQELKDTLAELDAEEAALDLADQFEEFKTQSEEAWYAAASGAEDAADQQDDAKRSMIDYKREVNAYALEVLKLPASKVTKLIAEIDKGNADAVQAELDRLTRRRIVGIAPVITYGGGAGGTGGNGSGSSGDTGNLGGSNPGNGNISMESVGAPTRGGTGVSATLNVYIHGASGTGEQIAGELQRWWDNGGRSRLFGG